MSKRRLISISPVSTSPAFTLVELLVVIVVIGILAAITIVAYVGITNRAIASSLQSDLANASNQLKMYYVDNSVYPTANQCPTPSAGNICLKSSSGNTLTYQPNPVDYLSYNIYDTNTNGTNYRVTDNNQTALATTLVCPLNFIVVPGSSTYGTTDFCVMKYEAKQVGATTTPISQASGLPWANISQTTAIANSPNVAGCTGCHLINEVEWMTITQNVLNVPSNWSGGAIGSGYIYSGHSDSAPNNPLAADPSDSNGYVGTGNYTGDSSTTSGMIGNSQRRTLTLSNGEVIWDFAGNVGEWTSATISANQQPGLSGEVVYTWKEWNNASMIWNGLPALSQPSSTGISGASGWSMAQGIGHLKSNYGETTSRAFLRGGTYSSGGGDSGVLYLNLSNLVSYTATSVGFRVSR